MRVVALGNSANAYFHICEIESHVLKLVDRTVCTDSTGKFTAYADSSGNPAYITRDAFGRIVRIADGTEVASGGALVRDLSLVWDATGLARLDYRGISSAGVQGDQPSVVRFVRAPGEYRIVRSVEASDVPVAVYLYDENDRIAGARDADGVGFLVSYDEIGRVASVTRSGAPTETVTTYAYGADQVTIATSAGGAEAPSRVVTWDPAIGGQPTSVTLEGPGAPSQTTSISYDEYGQVWKVADPLGRVSRTERDGRGNVCVAAEHESASGPVLRYTRAVYDDDDRVVRAFDVDGNESSFAYDTAGRLVSNLTVVAGSSVQGSTAAQSAYDEWGNHVASVSGDSTAHNLIRNGTFELDPLYPGNGWDGPSQGLTSDTWQTTTKPYMGAHSLKLGNSWVAPYITSDAIALKPETQYSLSASMDGWGEVHLLQYNTSGVLLDDMPVLYSAAASGAGMQRVSATVTARADAVTGRVRIQRPCDGGITIDNVRLELSDTASLDSIVENQSMERSAYGGVPQAWHRRLASVTTAVHEQSSDERVSGTYSAHIKHDAASADGYFVSDWMYVRPAEQYTVSVSIKTEASVGGADIAAEFYNAAGAIVPNSLVTAGFTKGTSDWRRHARTLTVPATGVKMRLFVRHKAGGGSAYFDAVSVTPGDQSVLTGFDTLTHTHAVSATGPSGVAVTAAHDARGHSISTGLIPRGQSEITLLERTYDDLDRLGSVTVAPASSLGITAGFSYTDAGRLTEVTDALSRTRTVDYDAAGRLTRTTSAAGVESEFVYDPLGRLVRTFAPSQGAEPTVTATSVAYDGLGRVAQTTYHDAMGVPYATVVPTYDLASRVASTTISGAITGSTELIYDALGRVERLVSTGPAGLTQTDVTYNLADQPTQVTRSAFDVVHTQTNTYSKTHELRTLSAAGLTWRVSSDARGLTQLASERALQTRSFDTAGRLAALRAGRRWSDSSVFDDLFESRLAYDTRDRIASVAYAHYFIYNDYADTYTYDPAGRLATWARTGAGATSATYTWDAACNLVGKTQGGTTTTFVSDADDRLVSATTGSSVTTYTHDLYGRRTSAASPAGTTTYGWNPLGQLTSVVSPQSTSVYSYGATGMREKAVVTQGGTTKTTESVWEGGRLSAERDSDGTLYRYVYAPDGTPLAVERTPAGAPAELFSYHTDAAGSVVAITGPSGAVVAEYQYDAFGAVTSAAGSDPIAARNPLRYRAYYLDSATGLYYLPARSYDPATARFLSPDPAPPSAGDPLSLNRYTYCAGDPVNSSDPTGAVTDVEWGAWDYYYNHDPATTGDRTAAATKTAETHAGVNTRRAEAAAREAEDRAAAMREREMQAATLDANLDRAQNWLATISAVAGVAGTLSLCAGAATAPTVAGPIALTGLAGFLFLTSVAASGTNALITVYRYNTGYLDRKTATVSAGLSIVGMVPVVGDGAAIGGAAMEWKN